MFPQAEFRHRFILALHPTAADPLCFEQTNTGRSVEIVRFVCSDGMPRRAQIVEATVGSRPLLPCDLPVNADVLRDFEWILFMGRVRNPQWNPNELLRVRFGKGKPPHLCAVLKQPIEEEEASVRA